MHQAGNATRHRLARYGLRTVHMYRLERDAGFLDVRGDCVDDGVCYGKRSGDGAFVAYIGANDGDVMQAGRAKDASRLVGLTNRNAHRRPLGRQVLHESSTEKTRSAEHDHGGHAFLRYVRQRDTSRRGFSRGPKAYLPRPTRRCTPSAGKGTWAGKAWARSSECYFFDCPLLAHGI